MGGGFREGEGEGRRRLSAIGHTRRRFAAGGATKLARWAMDVVFSPLRVIGRVVRYGERSCKLTDDCILSGKCRPRGRELGVAEVD